jgi:cytochrome P450 family 4
VTDEPTIAQKLLTYPECLEKNFFMELFGFSNGLISLKCNFKTFLFCQVFIIAFYLKTADRWKTERKLLNHTFSIPALQNFVPVFNRCIDDSIKRMSLKVGMEEFDIQKYVSDATMDAVLSMMQLKY